MKKLTTVQVPIAVAVIALVVATACGANTAGASADSALQVTKAEDTSSSEADAQAEDVSPSEAGAQPEGEGDGDKGSRPFLGISITTLPSSEAEELDKDGGAIVGRVLDNGPSAGLLHKDDVIVAIDSQDVRNARDVVHMVRPAAPGAVLAVTVLRGGDTLTVDITVGERPHALARRLGPKPGLLHRLPARFRGPHDQFVRAEVVWKTDDGFKTVRAVVGTLKNEVEPGSTSFVLVPSDGSDEITYEIDEHTQVMTRHRGELVGLNTEDTTLVIDVDGVARRVSQSDAIHGGLFRGPPLLGPGPRIHGLGKQSGRVSPHFRGLPWLRGHLEGVAPRALKERLKDLWGKHGDLDILVEGIR